MSATLIGRLETYLNAASLLTGYAVKYFRWLDADVNNTTPFIMLRQSGAGNSDINMQETRLTITLVATPITAIDADTRMQSILRYLRGTVQTTGVTRFDPVGTVVGPMYLENDRPVFQLTVACYTEDQ